MNIIKSRNQYYYLASPSVRISDEDCSRCHISNKCGRPRFQSHYKACHIKKSQKVTNMIKAIALVETGLARIIYEEGENLQKRIALATNIKELISLDYSVKETLTNIIKIQMSLQLKLDKLTNNT
ncbi:hypothetical protein [Clostridium sp.]|jgi:hypothetical protein|uniref:hypothetical protein n=1 Tax=Clostridium sp. TaxID=1506 RepID=UPI003EE8FDBE